MMKSNRKDRPPLKLHDRFPKFRLPLWGTLLSAVLLAGPSPCWPCGASQRPAERAGCVPEQPLLIVLNCLPVGMLVLVFTCLFRTRDLVSAALVNLGVCVLSIANRIKIEVRDEPVFPRDFALLKEVGSAVGTYDIQFPVSAIAVVVLFSLALAALGLFVGSRPFPVKRLRGWLGSLLGGGGQLRRAGGADFHGLRLQRPVQLLCRVQRLLHPLRVQRAGIPLLLLPPVHHLAGGPAGGL